MGEKRQAVIELVEELVHNQFVPSNPSAFYCAKFNKTEPIEKLVTKFVKKLEDDEDGAISISKIGILLDSASLNQVDCICIQVGQYEIRNILYYAFLAGRVDKKKLWLLLTDDCDSVKMGARFSFLGNSDEWKLMLKASMRCSPRWKNQRKSIKLSETVYHDALTENAFRCMLRHAPSDHNMLYFLGEEVPPAPVNELTALDDRKFQLFILAAVAAAYQFFPRSLKPLFCTVLLIQDTDDILELQRVLKALDLSVPPSEAGYDTQFYMINSQKDVTAWTAVSRFVPLLYERKDGVQYLLRQYDIVTYSQERFIPPCLPVIIGKDIWNHQCCLELDSRNLRFTDHELLICRDCLSHLVLKKKNLVNEFKAFRQKVLCTDRAILRPYPLLWRQTFYQAVNAVLRLPDTEEAPVLSRCQELEVSWKKSKDDRQARFEAGIKKIKSITEQMPGLFPSKPATRDEMRSLLDSDYYAFINQVKKRDIICFTDDSLARFCELDACELKEFLQKLKAQGMLLDGSTSTTISFQNKEQERLRCVLISQLQNYKITLTPEKGLNLDEDI